MGEGGRPAGGNVGAVPWTSWGGLFALDHAWALLSLSENLQRKFLGACRWRRGLLRHLEGWRC